MNDVYSYGSVGKLLTSYTEELAKFFWPEENYEKEDFFLSID